MGEGMIGVTSRGDMQLSDMKSQNASIAMLSLKFLRSVLRGVSRATISQASENHIPLSSSF